MIRDPMQAIRQFLRQESAAGLTLMVVAAVGLLVANSPLARDYFAVQKFSIGGLTVRYWINDALMAAFFLLVGLEIKRQILAGQDGPAAGVGVVRHHRRRLVAGVVAASLRANTWA